MVIRHRLPVLAYRQRRIAPHSHEEQAPQPSATLRVIERNSAITSRWSVGPRTSLGTKKPRDLRNTPCEEKIRKFGTREKIGTKKSVTSAILRVKKFDNSIIRDNKEIRDLRDTPCEDKIEDPPSSDRKEKTASNGNQSE